MMHRIRPWLVRRSLARRMALTFLVSYAAVLLVGFMLLKPILLDWDEIENQAGPDVAIYLALPGLTRNASGEPVFEATEGLRRLSVDGSRAWVVIQIDGRRFTYGPVPRSASAMLARLPDLQTAEFRVPGMRRPLADAMIATLETPAGTARFSAGGVPPESVAWGLWWLYLVRSNVVFAIPLFALLGMPAVLVAVPFVLRPLRRLVAQAEGVGPANLEGRLAENKTAYELLPVVRGFNAALDRLSRAMELQRRFIADVAHELRTPVAVLGIQIDALPEGEAKRNLHRGVWRLAQMIGQLLDGQRLSLTDRRRERVDLVALARDAVAEVAPLAVGQGYELALAAERPVIETTADPQALGRALANLLGNAVAHGGGRGLIEVRVKVDRAIEVADQGPGVSADAVERIFEPFARERWDKDGCGLGLHLAREIMRAHGGDAALIGWGPGAVFRLSLPPGLHPGENTK